MLKCLDPLYSRLHATLIMWLHVAIKTLFEQNIASNYRRYLFLIPIVNGSTVLDSVEVATVLGEEKGHAFQYRPGESDNTVWPGS